MNSAVERSQPAQQLAFDLPVREARGREDFFVTPSNIAAVNLIDSWPHWSPFAQVIVGASGSGKSHLIDVWRTVTGAEIVSIDRLELASVPELLAPGCLGIEDVPSSGLPERVLFHLVNHARENGASILMTSTEFPAHWQVSLPDLRSRLRAVGVAELEQPDDALLRAVLVKQFADRQVRIDERVVSYMLPRMERSMQAVKELVAEIDRQSLASSSPVTRKLVSNVMSNFTELS